MELSSTNTEFLYFLKKDIFSPKKTFLIFPEMKPCTFQPKLKE